VSGVEGWGSNERFVLGKPPFVSIAISKQPSGFSLVQGNLKGTSLPKLRVRINHDQLQLMSITATKV